MLRLSARDEAMLSGARGEGAKLAMRLIVRVASEFRAERLIDISRAHVASAYCQGQANVDFAKRLVAGRTRIAVPTTLTACSLNLRDAESRRDGTARELIELYERMGCDPVMTCAPYHAGAEPAFGDHLAWCESSAVVYANSVLGARSNRYVEFVDMCAAVTGRVPDCGLHRSENRAANILFHLDDIADAWLNEDWFYHVLGILVGRDSGPGLPAIAGLPDYCTDQQLRALGSAAASSGSVSMFHAIGITPEAQTLEHAFQGVDSPREIRVYGDRIRGTLAELGRGHEQPLGAVCVGAPHFSYGEFESLDKRLAGRRIASNVKFYAATSASVVRQLEEGGLFDRLMDARVELVVGRCTYYRPAMPGTETHVMTNSAKWAFYAPSGLGASVTFASLAECVESACAGRLVLSEDLCPS